jgi:hypothetical protein
MRSAKTLWAVLAVLIILITGATNAYSGTCNVPSASYPSIQSAVDVINCTEIVLASGFFTDDVNIGRTLEIRGTSSATTTVVGKITVEGSDTTASLKGLTISVTHDRFPDDSLVVVGNAKVIPDDVVIELTRGLIVRDGPSRRLRVNP